MQVRSKLALAGFLFGTVGMFVLSMLSLVSGIAELIFGPLFWPGRALSGALFGAEGSDGAVAFLILCNGLLYAVIFVGVGRLVEAMRARK